MRKYLFYGLRGEKLCFMHALMNAAQLHETGHEVQIIFEGESVLLPTELQEEQNILYLNAIENDLIAGVCYACSQVKGVLEENEKLPFPLLKDMSGHAGMMPYIKAGYEVVVI